MIFVICRLSSYNVSEWGDSNARPLRPERSALPTALHSVTFDDAKIVQKNKNEKFLNFFLKTLAQYKNLSYLCTRKWDGAIAQLVEQRTENPCVPGSIPGGTTCKNSQNVLKQRFGSFSFALKPKFGYILTTFWYFTSVFEIFKRSFWRRHIIKREGKNSSFHLLFSRTSYPRVFSWFQ